MISDNRGKGGRLMTRLFNKKEAKYNFRRELHVHFFKVLLITGLLINIVLLQFYSYREREVELEGKKWIIYQTITYVDRIMTEIDSIGEAIWTSSQVQGLKAANLQKIDYLAFLDCMNYLTSMELSVNSIARIRLYYSDTNTLVSSRDGVFYSLDKDAINYYTEWMEEVNNYTWVLNFADGLMKDVKDNKKVISYVRPIYSTATGKKIGLICIEVPLKTFYELIKQIGENEGFVIARDRTLITQKIHKDDMINLWKSPESIMKQSSDTTEGNFNFTYEGMKYTCVYETSKQSGWRFYAYYKYDYLPFDQIPLLICAILFILIFYAAYMMIIRVSKKKIMDPVETLLSAMECFEEGEFGVQICEKRTDVFDEIFRCFDHMSLSSKQLVEELIIERLRLKEGKLKMLQSQIKPHFLYNIFNNMIWMSEQKKYEGLEEMIYATAGYYKTSLNFGHDFICVADNLKQLQYYAQIQEVRFPGRFTCEIEFNEDIISLCIPNLLLQPLLENSINYGAAGKEGKTKIQVRGYRRGSELYFEVWDNGAGITKERLMEIRNAISVEDYQDKECFALANIAQRLRMYYQGKGSITIDSSYGEWTLVVLKLLEEESVCIN